MITTVHSFLHLLFCELTQPCCSASKLLWFSQASYPGLLSPAFVPAVLMWAANARARRSGHEGNYDWHPNTKGVCDRDIMLFSPICHFMNLCIYLCSGGKFNKNLLRISELYANFWTFFCSLYIYTKPVSCFSNVWPVLFKSGLLFPTLATSFTHAQRVSSFKHLYLVLVGIQSYYFFSTATVVNLCIHWSSLGKLL